VETQFPISGALGFAPQIAVILNAIPGAACFHIHYKLRHPSDIFYSISQDTGENFLRLLDAIIPVEDANAEFPQVHSELTRLYKELLASFARYVDCAYEILVTICEPRLLIDSDRKFLWKWLSKRGFKAGKLYFSLTRQDTVFFRDLQNQLKHSSDSLKSITVLFNSKPCLGYFLEAAMSDGGLGPSDLFHKGPHSRSTANSFNRDLRLLYHCLYCVADALRRAVLYHFNQSGVNIDLHSMNPEWDDRIYKQLFDKMSTLPQSYFSEEAGKIVPVAERPSGHGEKILRFVLHKVGRKEGLFRASSEGTVSKDGRYTVPRP
jgi:hypothetical protein